MKTAKEILLIALLVQLSTSVAQAQEQSWRRPPQLGEKEIEIILDTVSAGSYTWYGGEFKDKPSEDSRKNFSDEQLYDKLQEKVKKKYEDKYSYIELRDFKSRSSLVTVFSLSWGDVLSKEIKNKEYYISAIVVIPSKRIILANALDKALMEVREGSRVAIDQIRTPNDINKEDYKDEVVEILLDKGFKVVAKEYLEKLYVEQQRQQRGIYNESTTVQENNFSAVGYYLNIKLTETSLRIQVVNVSTGEYDGNVIVRFQ